MNKFSSSSVFTFANTWISDFVDRAFFQTLKKIYTRLTQIFPRTCEGFSKHLLFRAFYTVHFSILGSSEWEQHHMRVAKYYVVKGANCEGACVLFSLVLTILSYLGLRNILKIFSQISLGFHGCTVHKKYQTLYCPTNTHKL
jgi:hypothetical protein